MSNKAVKDKMSPVIIHAIDWTHSGGDQVDDSEAMNMTPIGCWIIGTIVRHTDEYVTVVGQSFDDGTYRHVVSIPYGCILSIDALTIDGYSAVMKDREEATDEPEHDDDLYTRAGGLR